jgi:hypothetical protein
MSSEDEIRRLTEQFRAFGANDPESWATSQVEEGINQYARFVFLHQAWQSVIPDGDTAWIDALIETSDRWPRGPGAGAGPAIQRLMAAGASREDLAEVVRVMQWQVLAGLSYQLADPGVVEYPSEDLPRVNWTLFETDSEDQLVQPIGLLHESVLDTDPSGREMRPKGVTREG